MAIRYPIYAKSRTTGLVVEFESEFCGVVVEADHMYSVGFKPVAWSSVEESQTWEILPFKVSEPTEAEIDEMERNFNIKIDIGTKYQKSMKSEIMDVYNVLKSFEVHCPATQHAIKKLLMPGTRGVKDVKQDLQEAHNSIKRAIELLDE